MINRHLLKRRGVFSGSSSKTADGDDVDGGGYEHEATLVAMLTQLYARAEEKELVAEALEHGARLEAANP